MHVEKGAHGPYWYVCQDDGSPVQVFRSKSAATRWMRDMADRPTGARVDEPDATLPSAADVRGILKDY